MQDPIKSYEELLVSDRYNDFIKKDPNAILIACFLTNGEWQFDFYSEGKVTIFRNNKLEIKDEILNPQMVIVKLDLKKIKIKIEKAIEIAREKLKIHKDETDKRIVLLQNFKEKPVWNITLLTKNMNIMNLKINALNGDIIGESFESIFKLKV
ncbi:hypothetical protein HY498_04835 [Candidatus Woesearchaeota archaeon]|nr:hypothetical protein [Candidatus Woesearchaeota archaeon]